MTARSLSIECAVASRPKPSSPGSLTSQMIAGTSGTTLVSADSASANGSTSKSASWSACCVPSTATLVTLAGGLSRTGFVKWFADGVAAGGLSPTFTIMALVTVYFCSPYMFAYVREPHGPHERHDAGDAGGRPTRCPGGQTRFGSRIDNRHHGRN